MEILVATILKNKKKESEKDFAISLIYIRVIREDGGGRVDSKRMAGNSSRNRDFSPNKQLSPDTGKVFGICGVYARISEMYFNYGVIRWSTSAMRANSTLLTSSMHPPSSPANIDYSIHLRKKILASSLVPENWRKISKGIGYTYPVYCHDDS